MIKLQKSTFYKEEQTKKGLCDFITNSRILSMSDECGKFEIQFAAKQNRRHAVFVNSGSSANLILIQALLNIGRLNKGDVVGVSALTWATNIMPLIQLGLQPFLVDCEIHTLNVSCKTLKEAYDIQPNMKAFFLTNTLGLSGDIGNIANFCLKNDILFLEDNCEALGSVVDGVLLGNFGVASTFSFFVGHHLSAIEGGMVCVDDDELYENILMTRSHGWDRNLGKPSQDKMRAVFHINDFYAKYTFYDLAYNVRPTEINGYLGNTQIEYWDEIVAKREENFLRLNKVVASNNNLVQIKSDHMEIVSSFAFPVVVKDLSSIEACKKLFTDSDVEIRPMIAGNMARQPFYRKYVGNPGSQPNAEFIHKHSFYFGNNPELTGDELMILERLIEAA